MFWSSMIFLFSYFFTLFTYLYSLLPPCLLLYKRSLHFLLFFYLRSHNSVRFAFSSFFIFCLLVHSCLILLVVILKSVPLLSSIVSSLLRLVWFASFVFVLCWVFFCDFFVFASSSYSMYYNRFISFILSLLLRLVWLASFLLFCVKLSSVTSCLLLLVVLCDL